VRKFFNVYDTHHRGCLLVCRPILFWLWLFTNRDRPRAYKHTFTRSILRHTNGIRASTTSQDATAFKANRTLAHDAINALVVADVADGRDTQVPNDVLLPTALVSVLLVATETLTVYDVGDDKAHRHKVRTCFRAPERDLHTCASPDAQFLGRGVAC
jgi:hypothetical protein